MHENQAGPNRPKPYHAFFHSQRIVDSIIDNRYLRISYKLQIFLAIELSEFQKFISDYS